MALLKVVAGVLPAGGLEEPAWEAAFAAFAVAVEAVPVEGAVVVVEVLEAVIGVVTEQGFLQC